MRSSHFITAALLMAATATTATSATAQGHWDWSGGRAGDRAYQLRGAGVPLLFPELRNSPRGRAFVMRNFDYNRDGRINRREADAANAAFAEAAGGRRDRFEWERFDRRDRVEAPALRPGGWDRRALRDYGFRQTPRGATFELSEEVLFAFDSDRLRPGAIARLQPLADYLGSERRVRVAIDGHTDSRGSDAYNQDLSERRAESVRAALEDMSLTRARFDVAGHGERQPVASNATPRGMQRNRRVEITLLGRRADEFR